MPIDFFLPYAQLLFSFFLCAFCWANKGENWSVFFAWQIVGNFCWMLFIQYLCCLFDCSSLRSVRWFCVYRMLLVLGQFISFSFISRTSTDMIFTMGHCAGPRVLLLLFVLFDVQLFWLPYTIYYWNAGNIHGKHFKSYAKHVKCVWCVSSFPKSFVWQVRFLSLFAWHVRFLSLRQPSLFPKSFRLSSLFSKSLRLPSLFPKSFAFPSQGFNENRIMH